MLVCSGDFHGCTYSLWVGQELLKDLREEPRLSVGHSKKWEASLVLLDILGKQWYLAYILYPDLWKLRKAEEELPYSTCPPKGDIYYIALSLLATGEGRVERWEQQMWKDAQGTWTSNCGIRIWAQSSLWWGNLIRAYIFSFSSLIISSHRYLSLLSDVVFL